MTQHVSRVAAWTLLASMVASAALALGPTAAQAQSTPWTRLSSGSGIPVSAQPRVVRWRDKLIVVWTQERADNVQQTLHTRILASNGKPTGHIQEALTWSSLSSDPDPFLLDGVPTIAFGGVRSGAAGDAYAGAMTYVQAVDGTHWTLGPGSLTQSDLASADLGFGAVDDGTGNPVTAGAYGQTDQVTVHRGLDPAVPATTPDLSLASTGDAQNVNVARDPSTGRVWAVWYSAASGGSQQGVRAASVYPTLGTPLAPAPLSTVTFEGVKSSANDLQDVGVTGRVGGGVWAAYSSGYPSPHKVVLWHVGTRWTMSLRTSGEVQDVGVTSAPDGRLWVYWLQGSTFYAARTNPSVTKFGVVRSSPLPTAPGQVATHTAADGSLGPLDAVVNASTTIDQAGNVAPEVLSARILEAPTVKVSAPTLSHARGGPALVTVTDAGVPVSGAKVVIGSTARITNIHGHASFVFPPKVSHGFHPVTVTAPGWATGTATFKIS